MSTYYLYLGGCVAIGGAYLLLSKIFNQTDEPTGGSREPEANFGEQSITNCEDDLNDAVRGINLYSKRRQELLEKELSQAKAMIADLSKKYDLNIRDPLSANETDAKPTSLKRHRSKSRSREHKLSDSSSEATSKGTTILMKASLDKQSCAKSGVKRSSTLDNGEAASSASTITSEQDPLVGNREVEPNEKVENWLCRPENLLPVASASNKHAIRQPVAMALDLSCLDREANRDNSDTNIITKPKRDSPKKLAPHLYKRLMLRKKSSVAVEEFPRLKSKSSIKSHEKKSKSLGKPEEKDSIASASKKIPELKVKETKQVKRELAGPAAVRKSLADSQSESETEHKTGRKCKSNSSGPKSVHSVESSYESGDESASQIRNDQKNRKSILMKNKKLSQQLHPEWCPPTTVGTLSPAGVDALLPSTSTRKPSQTRLLKKIDEVLEMKSNVKDIEQPVKVKNQLKASAASLKKPPSVESRNTSSSQPNEVDSDDYEILEVKSNTSDKKKELQVKSDMKYSRSNQEGPKSGAELLCPNMNACGRREVHANPQDRRNISASNMRPKSAGIEKIQGKTFLEKKREFLRSKYHLKEAAGQDKASLSDSEQGWAKAKKPYDKRKLFSKILVKDSTSQDGQKSEVQEIVMPIVTVNAIEKRKDLQTKHHMKGSPAEDGPMTFGKEVSNKKANSFYKRKEFEAKYHMPNNRHEVESAISAGAVCSKSRLEKRRDFLAQFQTKSPTSAARSKSPGNESNPSNKEKGNENEDVRILHSPKPADKQSFYAKPSKSSQLQRRMEYDSKLRMNFVPSNQSVKNSSKTSQFGKKKGCSASVRSKGSSSNLTMPASKENLADPVVGNELVGLVNESPTMNRLPNDTSRKAYLFDWESKSYSGEAKPEFFVELIPEIVQNKLQPTGKRLPPPRGLKRSLVAGVKARSVQLPTTLPPKKPVAKAKSAKVDSEDDDSSVGGITLEGKSSSERESQSPKRPIRMKAFSFKRHADKSEDLDMEDSADEFLAGNSSSEWCFDAKRLDESNPSSRVQSEESEDAIVKDMQSNLRQYASMRPSSETLSDEDAEQAAIESALDDFMFPKCPSDVLPNERKARATLQHILDLPMNVSFTRINDKLLSRSDTGLTSDDEESLSVRSSNLTNSSQVGVGKMSRQSSEVLAVQTEGFRQLASEKGEKVLGKHSKS